MTTLVNLTPHPLTLQLERETVTLAPSGTVARVTATPGALATVETASGLVPVAAPATWGAVEGLPAPQDGVLLITSLLVAQHVKRPDVLSPGTGPADGAIRDAEGRIVAVTRLVAHG